MMPLNKRLDLIEPKILGKSFRTGRGTANEVNFWIFDYEAEDEMVVRSHVDALIDRINSLYDDVRIVKYDLYDLMLDVLREKNYLEKVIAMEESKGSDAIINPIKKTLRLTLDDDLIIGKITKELVPQRDVIFLTGIGKAWPVIRSHTILNNLHSRVDRNALVMFFPGDYTNELRLFGEITDDNYYRRELYKHFDKFFENYRKGTQHRTDKMGVWISGFFGSGKSHFLKILSHLLSGKEYGGKKAIGFFEGKVADARVMADMQVAADASADVVLFNIDAEADADSKINKDAIVKVFMKVFNKMQGFCGSMPWIADLERQMTKDSVYDAFCARFKELSVMTGLMPAKTSTLRKTILYKRWPTAPE